MIKYVLVRKIFLHITVTMVTNCYGYRLLSDMIAAYRLIVSANCQVL